MSFKQILESMIRFKNIAISFRYKIEEKMKMIVINKKIYLFEKQINKISDAENARNNVITFNVRLIEISAMCIMILIIILINLSISGIVIGVKKYINNSEKTVDNEIINENNIQITSIEKQNFKDEITNINLIAEIGKDEYKEQLQAKIAKPQKEPTDDEIVDRILEVIDEKYILGKNKNVNEVKENLFLETKNIYGANITWESKNGFVNAKTGEIIRNSKGLGNGKDEISVIVEYGNVKKIKIFKINIIEGDKTQNEIIVESAKKKLDKLIKENEIFKNTENNVASLITSLDGADIKWYLDNTIGKDESLEKRKGYKSVILGTVFIYCYLIAREYTKISEREKKRTQELEMTFSNFIEEYIILNKAGYNLTNVIKYISKSHNGETFDYEIKKMIKNIESGMSTYEAILMFAQNSGSQYIKKFVGNLICNLKRGNKNINIFLKQELESASLYKKNLVQKRAAENNVKAIIPLIIVLVATMIIVVYPAIVALEI